MRRRETEEDGKACRLSGNVRDEVAHVRIGETA